MARITIFSCPKSFASASTARIQHNAIRSWKELGPDVKVMLAGNEDGVAEAAGRYGLQHLPEIRQSSFGTYFLSSIFAQARRGSETSLLAYVNADLILMSDFLESAFCVSAEAEAFVIVGRRWDLDIQESLSFRGEWEDELRREVQQRGRLHSANGSDYFIFPRACFPVLPDFAVGRSGWDNWMIYYARKERYSVVDASLSICAVHQFHGYDHLPGGRSHHRMPESLKNIQLAGGRHRIFYLGDADYVLEKRSLRRRRFSWKNLGREAEVLAVLHSESAFWGSAIQALYHPLKTLRRWRSVSRQPGLPKADH